MIKELIETFKHKDLWLYMAYYDVLSKYQRTTLGPFWVIIMTMVTIACMAVLGSVLFKQELRNFLPYVGCGMIVWGFLNSIIMDACNLFIMQTSLIQNIKLPLLVFALRMFFKNVMLFLHSLLILLIVLFFTDKLSLQIVWLLPAFVICAINSISFSIILGFFSTRYRDVLYIIQALLGIIVLLTPIMWKVEMLGEYQYLANYNPFTHFIALFRNPLLGESITAYSWNYILVFTALGLIVARYLYARFKDRLVFWL